jgi:hypothetical protein
MATVVARVSAPKSKRRAPNKSRAPRSRNAPRSRSARSTSRRRPADKRWSARVTRESNALDLDRGVFTWRDPKAIAASLKRSAEHSRRRKTDPYRSALSMLTFYVNRAGRNLSASKRRTLERAKAELRRQFGRE